MNNASVSRAKMPVNGMHSVLLAVTLAAGVCFTAWAVAGFAGLAVILLIVAAVLVFEPKLRGLSLMELYRGERQLNNDSQILSLVDVLAYRAGLPKRPELFVVPSLTLSAFSSGPAGQPAIALTEGLLRRLTLRETAGVIAHEMAHIRNGDTAVFRLSDWLARLTPLMALAGVGLTIVNLIAATGGEQVASWAVIAILFAAPALSSALQLSLSHGREDIADAEAARLTGDAMGFASALQRIESSTGSAIDDFRLPLPARRIAYPSLLRAHAPAKIRIARLLTPPTVPADGSPQPAFEPLLIVEQPMVSLVGYGPGDMRPRTRWSGLWY